MYIDSVFITIFSTLGTLAIGVIGYFLKRLFSQIDKLASKEEVADCNKKISVLASKDEVLECKNKASSLAERFSTKEEVSELRRRSDEMKDDLEFLKENTVRKDDFVRVFTTIEGKIDDVLTYLRDRKDI